MHLYRPTVCARKCIGPTSYSVWDRDVHGNGIRIGITRELDWFPREWKCQKYIAQKVLIATRFQAQIMNPLINTEWVKQLAVAAFINAYESSLVSLFPGSNPVPEAKYTFLQH